MARPKIEIDGKLVEKMASLGCKTVEIADYFGCTDDTINARFSEELSKGRANLKMSLRQWQLKAAEKGNATMLVWLGKQTLGQVDKILNEVSGPGGKPIETVNKSELTEAELDARIRLLLTNRAEDEE